MMKLKRINNLLLIMSMVLLLIGCGSEKKIEENVVKPEKVDQAEVISPEGEWLGKGGCYKLENISEGDYFIMRGNPEFLYGNLDQLYNREGNLIYSGFMNDYTVVEDGIWGIRENGMVDGEYKVGSYALKLDFNGQELTRFDLPIQADSLSVIDGKIYIYDNSNMVLAFYSAEGTELGRVDLKNADIEEFSSRLRTGGDGSLWLQSNTENGMYLFKVNTTEKNIGISYMLPDNMESLSTGTKENPFILATKDDLSYLDPLSGTITNILYWDECGMFCGELRYFIPEEDGFLCLSVTGLSKICPAKPEEIHPRTRLTLGTIFRYDGSSNLAAQFNAMNNDYYIDVIDYSDDGKLNEQEAQLKMNTEIMGGNGPDLCMLTDLGALQNTSAFIDMNPLIDADQELNREDFYTLNALETSGKLLLAPSNLSVSSFAALPSIARGRLGWTWDEYFDLKSKLPSNGVMASYLSAEFFLKNSVNLYAPTAIDWVNGTCNFNTPEFIRILKAAKEGYDPNCPIENPYSFSEGNSMIADGRMILEEAYFSDMESYYYNEFYYGQELEYIGWPTPDGSCGSVFYVSGIAIYATTTHLDGCWDFAKYVLKSTYIYKPAFEKAVSEATADKETTEEHSISLTQAQVERYRTLMENITVAVSDSNTINDIILEEAKAMFNGDKSPEETAEIIQSRLSLYISENM